MHDLLTQPAPTAPTSPVVGGVSPALLEALLGIGVPRHWAKNRVLHWSGQCPTSVLCVRAGRLRIRRFDSSGKEQILGWFDADVLVAAAPVIAGKPLWFDIVADAPSQVLHVPRPDFMALLYRDASVAAAVALLLSERLTFVMESHVAQAHESLAERVWFRLCRMAEQAGSDGAIPVTQQGLADVVGASRYRVGLELQSLAERGLIAMARGRLRILAPNRHRDG